jgi:hypothetical protein
MAGNEQGDRVRPTLSGDSQRKGRKGVLTLSLGTRKPFRGFNQGCCDHTAILYPGLWGGLSTSRNP